jgi:Uma2 family endonuclease
MVAPFPAIENRIVLRGVSWDIYQSLRADEENYHLRMTYDHGALEIMLPSQKHERIGYLLGRMIDQWTLFRKIDIVAGRNTTFSRKDLEHGLEPDNCYWVTNEKVMRGIDDVDLARDPPPDLVIEVDVTHSSIPKLPIYAALRVPEVWHWTHDLLQVLRLDTSGEYQPRKGSAELRGFPFANAVPIIVEREGKSDTSVVQQFIRALKSRR